MAPPPLTPFPITGTTTLTTKDLTNLILQTNHVLEQTDKKDVNDHHHDHHHDHPIDHPIDHHDGK